MYRYTVRHTPETVEVYDMADGVVIQSWDTFTTDQGREIHPNDFQAAQELCDSLNEQAAKEASTSRRAEAASPSLPRGETWGD